jgi:hypothetical protein
MTSTKTGGMWGTENGKINLLVLQGIAMMARDITGTHKSVTRSQMSQGRSVEC